MARCPSCQKAADFKLFLSFMTGRIGPPRREAFNCRHCHSKLHVRKLTGIPIASSWLILMTVLAFGLPRLPLHFDYAAWDRFRARHPFAPYGATAVAGILLISLILSNYYLYWFECVELDKAGPP